MDAEPVVKSVADQEAIQLPWGRIVWLVGAAQMPGAEQTLGVVTIYPGRRNPLHAHPNCEELLYVVSGACEHMLGDDLFQLLPGSVIRIPRGVRHWARCTSAEALVCIVSFSAPDRRTDSFEGDDIA
jgi:quercetin dioxygenase-like cupin family protein